MQLWPSQSDPDLLALSDHLAAAATTPFALLDAGVTGINLDQGFDRIRTDPRMAELRRRIGLR